MTTRIYLLFPLLLTALLGRAQSLTPSVIALAGGYEKTTSGVSVSWTLGEPIVDPLRSGNVVLTQGFQQPDLKVTTGFEDPTFLYDLQVFPNPTSSDLTIETAFQRELTYRLVDIQGKVLKEGTLSQKSTLPLVALPQGVYALYFTAEGRMIKSELIQKH